MISRVIDGSSIEIESQTLKSLVEMGKIAIKCLNFKVSNIQIRYVQDESNWMNRSRDLEERSLRAEIGSQVVEETANSEQDIWKVGIPICVLLLIIPLLTLKCPNSDEFPHPRSYFSFIIAKRNSFCSKQLPILWRKLQVWKEVRCTHW